MNLVVAWRVFSLYRKLEINHDHNKSYKYRLEKALTFHIH